MLLGISAGIKLKAGGAHNTYDTSGGAKNDIYPQNRHWKDESFAKFSLICKVKFHKIIDKAEFTC